MNEVKLEDWTKEFNKLSTEYITGINWQTVCWEEGEIGQAADDIQLNAYRNCYFIENQKEDEEGYSHNPSVDDWIGYEASCEDRIDFQYVLQEKWDDTLRERNSEE